MGARTITIRYFASIREAMRRDEERITTSAATVAALREELMARGSPWADCLGSQRAVRAAVNQGMAKGDTELPEGAEVAFFPPVTGG